MVVVLMDSKHHRTLVIELGPNSVIIPVGLHGNQYAEAVFTHGGFLFGDPIFYQTKGPTLPDWWWECESGDIAHRAGLR